MPDISDLVSAVERAQKFRMLDEQREEISRRLDACIDILDVLKLRGFEKDEEILEILANLIGKILKVIADQKPPASLIRAMVLHDTLVATIVALVFNKGRNEK